jgi:Holliday junction resolvasome RuvABC ATP-dependent DNA helicase subunit
MAASVFFSINLTPKSKEAKKLTRVANRTLKSVRDSKKSGKCITIYSKEA